MAIPLLEEEAVRKRTQPIGVLAYHELGRLKAIPERTELLAGVVVEKMPKDPIHTYIVSLLVEKLRELLPSHLYVRKEDPLSLLDSEPEPDVAVVDNQSYRDAHPRAAHLVIEVASTTLELDRAKRHVYAAARVPEYWIINLRDQTVEVFRQPVSGEYRRLETFASGDTVEMAGTPFKVRLVDLLGE